MILFSTAPDCAGFGEVVMMYGIRRRQPLGRLLAAGQKPARRPAADQEVRPTRGAFFIGIGGSQSVEALHYCRGSACEYRAEHEASSSAWVAGGWKAVTRGRVSW